MNRDLSGGADHGSLEPYGRSDDPSPLPHVKVAVWMIYVLGALGSVPMFLVDRDGIGPGDIGRAVLGLLLSIWLGRLIQGRRNWARMLVTVATAGSLLMSALSFDRWFLLYLVYCVPVVLLWTPQARAFFDER